MIRNRNPSSRGFAGNDTDASRGRSERFRAALSCALKGDDCAAGALTTWVDRTGNAVSPTQATGSKQAVATANQVKGHTAVLYDGVDDFHTAAATLTQPFQCLAVCKITAQGSASNHDVPLAFAASVFALADSDGNAGGPRSQLTAGSVIQYNGALAAAYALAEVVIDNTSGSIVENGTTRQTGTVGATNGTGVTLGALPSGTHSATIAIAEYWVGPTLSTSQLARARRGLRATYGTP